MDEKEDTSSLTSYLEIRILALVIDAKSDRDLETTDVPNFSIHTPIDRNPGEEKIITIIRVGLVGMMVQTDPEKYGPNVVYDKGKKLIYIKVI